MAANSSKRTWREGRDEMNLADFPISVLQRQQPADKEGRKLDRLEFEASRYDPATRRRVDQRVTLTTTARDGLPTPADEHVILALLYIAKHANNFATAEVRFAPGQLFEIMGWSPNGRSYDRLRDVLRRLKALTIRYENAWWDAAGRGYEEEVATGVISAYRIARQTSGPRKPGAVPKSWVTWTQQFHASLLAGNLKRLDLELFFKLGTPTAQRMYRFLDKRFYNSPRVSLDLVEFACGHVGLSPTNNVALLKRRLLPAIRELEEVGFLAPAEASERFQKVKAGVWRVQFESSSVKESEAVETKAVEPALPEQPSSPARGVVEEFYRLWESPLVAGPGGKDLRQAEALLAEHGEGRVRELLPLLVRVTRKNWPACRSFSGAVQKYLPAALQLHEQERRRAAGRARARSRRAREQAEEGARQAGEVQLQEAWEALSAAKQEAIRRVVLDRLGGKPAPRAFVHRLCLEEMQKAPTTEPQRTQRRQRREEREEMKGRQNRPPPGM
jgi:hypothetical protein